MFFRWKLSLTHSLCLVGLLLSSALAQTPSAESRQAPPPKLDIIIERQLLRFTTSGEALEWHLIITNQQEEVVFDSGAVYGTALQWPLKNQQDEAIQSGLYAYTLTTKLATEETARTQRGHLIVNRASSTDRVWLTSTQPLGLGAPSAAAQITIVSSREGSVGGVELSGAAPRREASGERSALPTRTNTEPTAERAAAPAAPTGTANRVAKFAGDGVSLVDSGIIEVGGNIGIGTPTPQAGLDYRGSSASFFTRDIGPVNAQTAQSALQLGLSNAGSRFAGVGPSFLFYAENTAGNKSFLGRVSGVWENPQAGAEAGAIVFQVRANSGDANALNERMRIAANGTVGIYGDVNIGGTSAGARLGVAGAPATVHIETAEILRLQRPAVHTVKNRNTAGFFVGAFEPGINGRTRLDIRLSGTPNNDNIFAAIPDVNVMSLLGNGNVGIGITDPVAKLQVLGGSDTASVPIAILDSFGSQTPLVFKNFGVERARIRADSNGNLVFSTLNGQDRDIYFRDNEANTNLFIQGSTGNVGIGTTNPGAKLHIAGMTSTQILQITSGADLSEQFEVKAAPSAVRHTMLEKVQPGMVVSIDSADPGKLVVSSQAYDRKVAGIISGAGGVKPGLLMGQTGSVADGDHPVALTGRVYCWADASNSPINPGDLLTTSRTPGHAMKVSDYKKAQGAIIGKAMTSLKSGQGLVLVLVTLQ